MLSRSLIRKMTIEDRLHVRNGAFLIAACTGAFAYVNYREFIKKEFQRSEGHHRFEKQRITNMTPWKQLYMFWHRMPDQEYEAYYKFAPFFLLGQLDLSKEILIPRNKKFNGISYEGFDVINPIYCYEGGKISIRAALAGEDPVSIDRAAIIVNRGWIPAQYRDKRSRPGEVNTKKLFKINGTFRKGKNVHDYKIPNDPDSNEWNNLSLEDIGIYWELPNFDE